jgi:hypothetical protein
MPTKIAKTVGRFSKFKVAWQHIPYFPIKTSPNHYFSIKNVGRNLILEKSANITRFEPCP